MARWRHSGLSLGWVGLGLGLIASASVGAQVVINEIHYEPGEDTLRCEFVELHNSGRDNLDLSGWFLSEGIFYQIPPGTALPPDGYLVIAEDPSCLHAEYGVTALGPFSGRLSNDGDRVVLRDPAGTVQDEVEYGVGFPWPTGSAGQGGSMELIHPTLDNDLGGSWRVSRVPASQSGWPVKPIRHIRARAVDWRYRKGWSEPSVPGEIWRLAEFVEDASWETGQLSIGHGGRNDLTELSDMRGGYSSVYLRKRFQVTAPGSLPRLRLRVYTDHSYIIWLNGAEVCRRHVGDGARAFSDVSGAPAHPLGWEEYELAGSAAQYVVPGTNVVAVHALAAALDSEAFSFDLELLTPAAAAVPTPGARNSVYAERAPPQIRQVTHSPTRPRDGEVVVVTAKVTDPEGVKSVKLHYQVVVPGGYVPAFLPVPHDTLLAAPETLPEPNPAFEDPRNWVEVPMTDDGRRGDVRANDAIYTVVLPGQGARVLLRYRITAADAGLPPQTVQVPYPDDGSLNFAAFIYDGVPGYRPELRTVHPEGLGHEYTSEAMSSVAVYHVLTREADWLEAHAYDPALRIPQWRVHPNDYHPAYDAFNWEGAVVYEDAVYDHVRYRLRQANTRYMFPGKRALRFRFHPGHRFQARDDAGRPYPERWRSLNLGMMVDIFGTSNFGLVETMNSRLWELVGVPNPKTHYVHLRVVDGPAEAPSGPEGQYAGDFWGLYLAMEDYDAAFIEARQLPDGNLYKLKAYIRDGNDLKRHQGRLSVRDDADFQNALRHFNACQPEAWLRAHGDWDRWYRFNAVAEAVRHWDFGIEPSHLKNQAWFFAPSHETPFGQLWFLPWDSDLSWGPGWYAPFGLFKAAAYGATNTTGHPVLRREMRAALREFRDLLWRPEAIEPMLDELAASIRELSWADNDRWSGAPNGFDYGSLDAKVQDMKNFAFIGWEGTNGLHIPAGGQGAYLDSRAAEEHEAGQMPETPLIGYVGPSGYPVDQLIFELSPFRDPQGNHSFGAVRWRVAEVASPSRSGEQPPAWVPSEWRSVWESAELPVWADQHALPGRQFHPARTYRVRAKVRDTLGFWSHWSAPVEFVAGPPASPPDLAGALRITEVMYHAAGGSVFDFVELANLGRVSLDLTTLELGGGVDFAFRQGAVGSLAPGERVVLVEDLACFRQRYPDTRIRVAGQFRGSLSNRAGRLELWGAWLGLVYQCLHQDDWYPATDGAGFSLVWADPLAPPELASQPAGWRQSEQVYGSPGSRGNTRDRDGDGLPDEWELVQGLAPEDPRDAGLDPDGDGLTTRQEYVAGTDPHEARSMLRLRVTPLAAGVQLSSTAPLVQPADPADGVRFYSIERRLGFDSPWQAVGSPARAPGTSVVRFELFRPDRAPVFYRLKVWLAPE